MVIDPSFSDSKQITHSSPVVEIGAMEHAVGIDFSDRATTGIQIFLCEPSFQCWFWQLKPQYHTSMQLEHDLRETPTASLETQQFAHSFLGSTNRSFFKTLFIHSFFLFSFFLSF